MRAVLFHYHIFKNSGTTFDSALKRRLGGRFVEYEAPQGQKPTLQSELGKVITGYGDALAFSSHTARLPVPLIDGIRVEPVVFIRHPLLRLKSIYTWMKKTNLKVRLKSLAGASALPDKNYFRELSLSSRSFEHWVAQLLDSKEGRNAISNPQTQLLSGRYELRPKRVRVVSDGVARFDLGQAKENLSHVKLLGRTENFDEDIVGFCPLLLEMGIPLKPEKFTPRNISDKEFNLPLDGRILRIQSKLGSELSDSLEEFMSQDMELYQWVCNALESKARL